MTLIDADAHVVECERTWEFMEESESAWVPQVMVYKNQARAAVGRRRGSEYWMIGGRVFAKDQNIGADTAKETRRWRTSRLAWPIWMSWVSPFRFSTRASS